MAKAELSESETWDESRMFVLGKLNDMETNRREDRDENRKKFTSIFESIDGLNKSLSGVKMSTKILLALTSAIFIGMVAVIFRGVSGL